MWPADVLELLTVLADLQKYDELWGFVFRCVSTHSSIRHAKSPPRICFPQHLGFEVLHSGPPGDIEQAPQCCRVSHSSASNFLLLTWAAPTFDEPEHWPYTGQVIESQTLTQRRVYRIHASGSTIRCFSIVRDGTHRTLNYYRREDKRLHLLRTNADILDETGFERLVKHS
jgi:hypothetical protein